MSNALRFDAKTGRLRITGELTIYQAAAAKAELLKAMDSGRLREIDLGAVTELDTAGLQLLLLAKRTAAERGEALQLVNHSEPVLDVLTLLNVDAALGDPVLIPAASQEPAR